jgi:hypothetical protein
MFTSLSLLAVAFAFASKDACLPFCVVILTGAEPENIDLQKRTYCPAVMVQLLQDHLQQSGNNMHHVL